MPPEPARIWVVDDDRSVRFVLAAALREAGFGVACFADAAAALQALRSGAPDLLFTDVRMPGEDGLTLLERLKAAATSMPVIVMSAYTDVASAAGAFRGGAHEFLSKPFDLDHAVALARQSLRRGAVPAAPAPSVETVDSAAPAALLGDTPAMQALFRAIGKIAQAPLSVLITGETGTGKELVARALHQESPRAGSPFVALNTAAIPAELLESELFGHEAGAFTGAGKRHVGRFEQADGGTLFLDEIGDMPLPLQTRLLRVLAGGEFFRVGGRALIRVDVRVIAATHQPLQALVAAGRFRADLLHRLDVLRVQIPPLRERGDDIPILAGYFLANAARRLHTAPKRLTQEALAQLQRHAWPGNVRELENLCWRLATLAAADEIDDIQLRAWLAPVGAPMPAAGGSDGDWPRHLAEWTRARLRQGVPDIHAQAQALFEQTVLETALDYSAGRRGEAAARLGLGRNTLTRKLGARHPRRPGRG